MKPTERLSRGFTLVEVMVAMFVMAILAGLAWRGVDSMVRTRDISAVRLEETLRLSTVLAQWEQDLSAVQDTGIAEAVAFDGSNLRLTRRTDKGMQLVVWSLKQGMTGARGGTSTLMRWASQPLATASELTDFWMRSQQFQGVEPGQIRTLEGVGQWQLYCYRSSAWSNCQSSGDLQQAGPAPAGQPQQQQTARAQTPDGVRLVLTFAGGNGLNGTLTRDIQLGPRWHP